MRVCVCEKKWVGGLSSFECVCVCVGFRLHRVTSLEREEKEKVRKREKKQEEEETMQQATWVKYTFRVKHQVKRFVQTHSQNMINKAGNKINTK